ncbi:M20 family metallopeptidase [Amycolatopsis saalfeldensis]|uniref:Glutamate carboxypeptidase n=1 Tax=Amycolatopsis saalfeldensis TaxID=394193 RepID=A0A1H8YLS1_9PSEU|nr:M20 family metallopeptidase [Amycolatopsis saalfeldensis]SEP53130.1 glutamate carboxypeptidase [Amycolatopsis saalfeldensis]
MHLTDQARTVARLAELVSIETPSGHTDGLLRGYALLREWGGPIFGRPPEIVTVQGTPHLRWRPEREPGVLLLGHADTVWPLGTGAGWPFEVDGGRASGPGVFDMKAGLVAAFDALELARDIAHVGLLVTGDEEIGSPTSRALIEEAATGATAVLVLEPSLGGALKTARKGGAFYTLDIAGRAAHAGLEPGRGINAMLELAHQTLALDRLGDAAKGTTVTPTVASAGTTTNTVPAAASLRVDVRAWERAELERVHRRIGELSAVVPGASISVSGEINRLPLERESSRALLTLARRIAGREGLGELTEAGVGGASDGNFTAALGIPTLDGLGPDGDGAHARHEWAELSSLAVRSALVARLLDALADPLALQ